MKQALTAAGAQAKIVAPRLGFLTSAKGKKVKIDFSLLTTSSVMFDAVYIPGGEKSVAALRGEADALHFVNEAYKHCKTIAATGAGAEVLRASYLGMDKTSGANAESNQLVTDEGVITSPDAQVSKVAADFIKAIAQHRHWSREMKDQVPA
jgi:catalase